LFYNIQVRTPADLQELDGLVLPGGESTAMGLIGTTRTNRSSETTTTTSLWSALQQFRASKPTWGTCAGMILLAEQCVGASAVIENGQALVGGMDMLVCRNYFGSQVSSFEMPTSSPPTNANNNTSDNSNYFPGVFIRAPAILSVGADVQVLATVMATPCRQAAVVLQELERKLSRGENVVVMGVIDALDRTPTTTTSTRREDNNDGIIQEDNEKNPNNNPLPANTNGNNNHSNVVVLPGAANGTNAREVICAVRKDHLLCTAFHPELTEDYRWHQYFVDMVRQAKQQQEEKASS
jgi:pyridoxal 5'-phosphate synthase pdxT subunit